MGHKMDDMEVVGVEVDGTVTPEQAFSDFLKADAAVDEAVRAWEEAHAQYEPILAARNDAQYDRAKAALTLLTVLGIHAAPAR